MEGDILFVSIPWAEALLDLKHKVYIIPVSAVEYQVPNTALPGCLAGNYFFFFYQNFLKKEIAQLFCTFNSPLETKILLYNGM